MKTLDDLVAELHGDPTKGRCVFVRADLGQIEPRVLAAVSGDRALAAACATDDLYAPVARSLGVGRVRTFARITLGQAKGAILGGCLLVALVLLAEFGAF